MASEFFSQLQTFSERVFDLLGLPRVCPWRTASWPTAAPKGLIVHYTAGPILSALRWFMRAEHGAKASAHLVIGRTWPAGWQGLAEGLPLVLGLPAAVVQCVPPGDRAWHATWANHTHYGIELENHGEIRRIGGEWRWWAPSKKGAAEWTSKWRGEDPEAAQGKHWEAYTDAQLVALYQVVRRVREVHPGIRASQLLGHEHVQANKFDPGPCLPLTLIREVGFAQSLPAGSLFDGVSVRPAGMEPARRRKIALDWVRREFPLSRGATEMESLACLRRVLIGEDEQEWRASRVAELALDLLGYRVPQGVVELETVQTFQRMMGLGVDGQVGPKTREALISRLAERGIL